MISQRFRIANFSYAFFLVCLLPLSLPFCFITWQRGLVGREIVLLTVLFYILSGLGITLGYHRMLTHRAFIARAPVKFILLLLGTLAMQGPPASWASIHIQHHRHSDKPGDSHSPIQQGFWYAHCGWLFFNYVPNFRKYGKWLLGDKQVRHFTRYYFFYSNLGLLLPYLFAGWVGVLWAGFLRVFLVCHVTWAVNSIGHLWGKRRYQTLDNSRNGLILALLSFGEGWHNNHHRYLQSAYLGHRWYEIDMGKWIIQMAYKLGLVCAVKRWGQA